MTVTSEDVKKTYAGDGSTATFNTVITFAANNEIAVSLVDDTTGVSVDWTLGTEYTLTGAGTGNAGTLTVDTSPTDFTPLTGETLVIELDPAFTQPTPLPRGGTVSPKGVLEPMHDNRVRQILTVKKDTDRSLKAPVVDASPALELPIASLRAGKVAAFDSNGDVTVSTADLSDIESNTSTAIHAALTSTHGVSGDIVGTTDTQTMTNKTVDMTDNTITGTTAEFNAAISDATAIATTSNTITMTGKTLTAPTINGIVGGTTDTMTITNMTGASTQVTLADESIDTNNFILFANDATGDQAPKTGSNLTFNSATGELITPTGSFTNVDGILGANTPAAADVTTLDTDGTANIDAQKANFLEIKGGTTGNPVTLRSRGEANAAYTHRTTGNGDHVFESAAGASEILRLDGATMNVQLSSSPLVLKSFTVATLPTAVTGGLIHVTDETGGQITAFSEGTNWRRVTDRAVVS